MELAAYQAREGVFTKANVIANAEQQDDAAEPVVGDVLQAPPAALVGGASRAGATGLEMSLSDECMRVKCKSWLKPSLEEHTAIHTQHPLCIQIRRSAVTSRYEPLQEDAAPRGAQMGPTLIRGYDFVDWMPMISERVHEFMIKS